MYNLGEQTVLKQILTIILMAAEYRHWRIPYISHGTHVFFIRKTFNQNWRFSILDLLTLWGDTYVSI